VSARLRRGALHNGCPVKPQGLNARRRADAP